MGPFSGRLLSVSAAMLPGSRTSKQRHISLDSLFMSQWMKASKNSHAAITQISAAHLDSTTTRKGTTGRSKDKSQTLIGKMSAQFPSLTKNMKTDIDRTSDESKQKGKRRRGRRKSS